MSRSLPLAPFAPFASFRSPPPLEVKGRRGEKGSKRERRRAKGICTIGFWVPTTFDHKKCDYNIVLRCPHNLQKEEPPQLSSQNGIYRAAKGLRRSPPPAQKFWGKKTKPTTKVTLTSHQWLIHTDRYQELKRKINGIENGCGTDWVEHQDSSSTGNH